MAGRVPSLVARGRRVPWRRVLAVGMAVVQEGRRRWSRLSAREQQELTRIVRKAGGRSGRLTDRERQELWRLVRKAAFPD